ncbi:hypothetical protein [Arthrobacter sp. STN4]|uniref:hypothetical protein n=1 Tax=Arthrobacter sp. STN4 TaxID=2923276 RepID=UPI002119E3AC|nr:hypothetical protein [Arthrobacter sp. STN4]MCQ9163988.1 hypothetical protein [Arthrobacter sp. STN4]
MDGDTEASVQIGGLKQADLIRKENERASSRFVALFPAMGESLSIDSPSILIIAGICVFCLLPVLFRPFFSFDKCANDIEVQNPDVAKAIRDARRDIDRGRGRYGP